MSAENTFVTLVLSDATITTNISDRIHPSMMPPEATTPAITYFVVAGKPDVDTCADLYDKTRIQANIYADRRSTVLTIYSAMASLLHKYSGVVGGQSVVSIIQDFKMSTYEPETKLYRQIVDYTMHTKGV